MDVIFYIAGVLFLSISPLCLFFLNKKNTELLITKGKNQLLEKEIEFLKCSIQDKNILLENLQKDISEKVSFATSDKINPILLQLQEKLSKSNELIFEKNKTFQDSILEKNANTMQSVVKDIMDKISHIEKSEEVNKNGVFDLRGQFSKFIRCFDHSGKSGRIGEASLLSLLEACGFKEGFNMYSQLNMQTSELDGDKFQNLRPDFVLRLPEGRFVLVDSKMSQSFVTDEIDENLWINEVKKSLKVLVDNFAKKPYISTLESYMQQQYGDSVSVYDFSIIFLPTDIAFEQVSKNCGDILKNAWSSNIIVCGPSGMLSILHVLRENRRVYEVNSQYQSNLESMQKIIKMILTVMEKTGEIGLNLSKAVERYNLVANAFNRKQFLDSVHKLSVIDGKNENTLQKAKYGKSLPIYNITKQLQGDVFDIDDQDSSQKGLLNDK